MRSLAEDDEVFCGDISIDEVSSCAIFIISMFLYGLLDGNGDETVPTCIVSEVYISLGLYGEIWYR